MIQRALNSQRTPHAYLFAGLDGVGKEMMALRLARILLCQSPITTTMPDQPDMPALDACGQCQDCQVLMGHDAAHPDLSLIYRQLARQHPDSTIRNQKALFLGVEVIRHFLVEKATIRPNRGKARVFIVREAERMNEAAQNSLLKTLEEPPTSTFIILICSALDRMLPTTRSRCQEVIFQALPPDFIQQKLSKLHPDIAPSEAAYLARHANGSLGAAVLHHEAGLFPLKQKWGQELAKLIAGNKGQAPHALAKPLEQDAAELGKRLISDDSDLSATDATRTGLQALLSCLADFYLDATRRTAKADLPMINNDQPKVIDALCRARKGQALLSSFRYLAQADNALGRNAPLELLLNTLFIQLNHPVTRQTA
jgi:DNA polymerase III subunit delta'